MTRARPPCSVATAKLDPCLAIYWGIIASRSMTMTTMVLQQACSSPPRRLLLQRFSQPGGRIAPLHRLHRAIPRHRCRVTGGSREPSSVEPEGPQPESLRPEAQPLQEPQERPRKEQWRPASFLSGWKGSTSLLAVSAASGGGLLGESCQGS